jgi:hypothetical protein
MTFSTIRQKTILEGFSPDQKKEILGAMEIAYNKSSLARSMFDAWKPTISIDFLRDQFHARRGRGILETHIPHFGKVA